MITRALSAAIASAFVFVGQASAAPMLFTPPQNFVSVNLTCTLANVGNKPIEVRVEVIGDSGGVLASTGNVVVQPNLRSGVAALSSQNPDFCRFTVLKGGKRNVRAIAQLFETSTNTTYLLPAS